MHDFLISALETGTATCNQVCSYQQVQTGKSTMILPRVSMWQQDLSVLNHCVVRIEQPHKLCIYMQLAYSVRLDY